MLCKLKRSRYMHYRKIYNLPSLSTVQKLKNFARTGTTMTLSRHTTLIPFQSQQHRHARHTLPCSCSLLPLPACSQMVMARSSASSSFSPRT
mgnify:FL=1